MGKENTIIAGNGKPTVRITRARAAAYRSTGGVIPLKASDTKQDQKRLLRGNSKRGALDDSGHTGLVTAHFQHKRRAVLKDVTNICCENSYRNCINAAKVQAKNLKTTKSGTCKKDSKVSLAVAVEVEQVHEDAKTKTTNEMQKMTISDSQEITFSMKVEENALSQQPKAISRDGGDNNISFGATDSLLKKVNTGMPSQLMNLSKAEVSCFEDLANSDGLDFVDIDSDLKTKTPN